MLFHNHKYLITWEQIVELNLASCHACQRYFQSDMVQDVGDVNEQDSEFSDTCILFVFVNCSKTIDT